jgi:hypothetical protein
VTFVAHLSATEPSGRAPVNGSDVEVVARAGVTRSVALLLR